MTAKYDFRISRNDTHIVLNFLQRENFASFKNMSLNSLIFTHDIWYRLISNLKTSLLVL